MQDLTDKIIATDIRGLLRNYVGVRVKAAAGEMDLGEATRRSEALHNRIWALAAEVGQKEAGSIPAGLFIQALNEVIDLHLKRVTVGVRNRVPPNHLGYALPVDGRRDGHDGNSDRAEWDAPYRHGTGSGRRVFRGPVPDRRSRPSAGGIDQSQSAGHGGASNQAEYQMTETSRRRQRERLPEPKADQA
jgi:hypothetical protein